MKKNLINLFLTFLILGCFESKISADENNLSFIEASSVDEDLLSDYIFLNNLESLIVDHDNLLLEIQGIYYPVRSLQKIGNQWRTAFNGYCPQMHPLCECGQCHNPDCRYYVKFCPRKRG